LEQAAPVLQSGSTVREGSYAGFTSTSDRTLAYQYHSSTDSSAEAVVINRVGREPQKEPQKVLDPTAVVPAPIPVTIAASNPPRQDAKTPASSSAVPQDSSASPGTDPRTTLPPDLERAGDAAALPDAGALAFAARLTPATELQPPASEPNRPAEPLPASPTPLQSATPLNVKQTATAADLPADAHSGEGGAQPDREKAGDVFAKPETLLPQIHAATTDQTAIPSNHQPSTNPLPLAAHLDQAIVPPTAPPNSNHEITLRIPDSTGQDTAVRFVERGGEIHVSVRTGDGGIRTEVWQPGSGSNTASSQNDSHQPFADPDGSNGRDSSSGSNSEQESKQQNRPRWVEELEGSIGKQDSKETPQLWQA
jgi:hypothetical protein